MANNIEQLKTALINADKAGDTEAAKKLAAAIAAERPKTSMDVAQTTSDQSGGMVSPAQVLPEVVDPYRGFGEGTQRLLSGLKQLGLQAGEGAGIVDPGASQAYTQQETQRRAQADETLNNIPGQNIAQAVSEYGPFLYVPGGATRTALGRFGVGAAQGGVAGGTQFMEEGQSRGLHAGGGALIGGALNTFLAPLLSRVFNKPVHVAEYVDEAGKITDKGKSLLTGSSKEGDLIRKELSKQGLNVDANQIDNYNQLVDQGLKPTKAQVTQSPDDFRFQTQNMDAQGQNGANLRLQVDEQNSALISKADELASGTGGVTQAEVETGASVSNAIRGKALEMDAKIGQLYKQARENVPGSTISPKRMVQAINDAEHFGEKSTQVARGELFRRGITDKEGNILRGMSVQEGEEVRQVMNKIYDQKEPLRNLISREIKDALDEDVLSAAGKDVFTKARAAKRSFHKEFTEGRTDKFDIKNKNILSRVLDGSLSPDKLYRTAIRGGNVEDLLRVKGSLNTAGETGKQAWNDLRGQVIREALDAATTGGKTTFGDPVFSAKAFKKVVDRYANQGKLTHLFSPQEMTEIGAFTRAGELRIPVQGTGLGGGPSSSAIQKVGMLLDNTLIGKLALRSGRQVNQFLNEGKIAEEVTKATQPGPTIERAVQKITRKPLSAPIGGAALGGR